MSIEKIRDLMAQSDHKRIEYKDFEGNSHTGFVDGYEDATDNDGNESSICINGEKGEMLVVWEHEIEEIKLLD